MIILHFVNYRPGILCDQNRFRNKSKPYLHMIKCHFWVLIPLCLILFFLSLPRGLSLVLSTDLPECPALQYFHYKLFILRVLLVFGFTHNSLTIQVIICQKVFRYFDFYILLFITIQSDMKTAQTNVNNLINTNIFPLKVSRIRQCGWYLGITKVCQNTHFTYAILQYTCIKWIYYTRSFVKLLGDMSQYKKVSDFKYAKFQILVLHLYFRLLGQVVYQLWINILHIKSAFIPYYGLYLCDILVCVLWSMRHEFYVL